ncbi:Nucleoside-diphosphate-sugar epimerase [Microbulbifer donghaiensis]|uniref:Nucleoside-diphosphate-sugar epimerase n=1 Tax=Microbulbifer donghaiensis TaxID=494016 RepID=A0A1M5AG94_9GAMM|nr:NAD-dependent epimerase/dehydratase family protein [Microbulbifer donghaiensis]SHF29273.1 Nucleoside-diphosphate-sugar epimerase [Microbulbifer donghaiensis]
MAQEKLWILGCGDLGARLALHLNRQEYSVYGMRRNPLVALASKRRADVVNWRRGDATKQADIERLLADGADVVLATFTPDEHTQGGYHRAYIDTATALAKALVNLPKPPRLLIWVSSTRVYGQSGDQLIDEQTPAIPSGFQGDILLAAEEIIRSAVPTTCVVRFAGIYGPGRDRLLSQVRAGRCAPPQPPQFSNRIHIDDCIGFLIHLIEKHKQGGSPEQLYIGADCIPVPMYELQQWLVKAMGYTSAHLREIVQTSERRSKKLSNKRMLASGYEMKYPDYRSGYSALLESEG